MPRVCMAEAPVQAVAWAPLGAGEEDRGVHAAATLATLGSDGGVRVWRPRGLPLRRGGKGDPSKPHLMKPQLYTFLQHDAAHPSGDEVAVAVTAAVAVVAVAVVAAAVVAAAAAYSSSSSTTPSTLAATRCIE